MPVNFFAGEAKQGKQVLRRSIPKKTERRKLPALYTDATKALAQITRIDEVKKIRDQAIGLQVYAKQAQDPTLIEHATEVRVQAETRAGDLLLDMKAKGRRDPGGRGKKIGSRAVTQLPKLDDLGITKMQASRWQKLAIMKTAFPKNWDDRLRRMCRLAVAVTEGDAAVISEARADLSAEKTRRREKHEREMAEKIFALPDKKNGVIYADPPWPFETWSHKASSSPNLHYATCDLKEIMNLDIERIVAADCVLFLWAITPMLPQALEVMTAWGFTYRSHCVWEKTTGRGTGYWFINKHEILLVGTRGNIPAPAPGTQCAIGDRGTARSAQREARNISGNDRAIFSERPEN